MAKYTHTHSPNVPNMCAVTSVLWLVMHHLTADWWITDLLVLSSWVFRHLMKLRWSAAHWHFGSHLNYDYVGVRYRRHRKDGRRLTQNQRSFIPHRFPCTSPLSFILWSCLQCGCLWDLSAAYPWAVCSMVAEFYPKLEKLAKQFPHWGSLKYETAELQWEQTVRPYLYERLLLLWLN